MEAIREITSLPLNLHCRGKVREIFALGHNLLIVASDRISAFDVIFQEPIPLKGMILTQLSHYWFNKTRHIVANHVISCELPDLPQELERFHQLLNQRFMIVKKAEPLRAECVVRGYLDGSAWRDYHRTGEVCGIKLLPGMKQKMKLPEPIFTPATKAEDGHDENISFQQVKDMIGQEVAEFVKEKSMQIYQFAHDLLEPRGIILSDTKFEFGLFDGNIILIDECLTPDSSRLWVKESYCPGVKSISLDKQYVRDYLESTDWDKSPPPPPLPSEIINNTTKRYLQAYQMITGQKFKAG